MKAVTYRHYGSPEVLAIEELAKPTPGDSEVLIRVQAAAVTAADCAFRRGEPLLTRVFNGLRGPKDPVLGTEFAGRIVAVGSAVRRFSVDDEIVAASGTSFGAHAEYLCLPEDGAIGLKPTNLEPDEAAAVIEGALTALPFLRDEGQLKRGHKILINGASGSIGTSAVQLARHFGAEVTGVCSTKNVELVRSLGAGVVIDYTQEDFTQTDARYDVILDAVGKSSFSRCKHLLEPGGVYLSTVPSLAIMAQMLWTSTLGMGSRRAKIAFTGLREPADKARDLDFLKGLVEGGELGAFIDARYTFEEAAEAHRHVETGHKRGNVILSAA